MESEKTAASVLYGVMTDPRTPTCPARVYGSGKSVAHLMVRSVSSPEVGTPKSIGQGPTHRKLPDFDPIGNDLEALVLLKLGDHVSTNETMPAGSSDVAVEQRRLSISKISSLKEINDLAEVK
jgi:hypothetical protein